MTGTALKFAAAGLLLLLLASSAQADTLVVNQTAASCANSSPPGLHYTGIQDAINASKDGDTIFVCAGQYNESVAVNRSVTLRAFNGSDYDVTVWGNATPATVVNITAPGVDLSYLVL